MYGVMWRQRKGPFVDGRSVGFISALYPPLPSLSSYRHGWRWQTATAAAASADGAVISVKPVHGCSQEVVLERHVLLGAKSQEREGVLGDQLGVRMGAVSFVLSINCPTLSSFLFFFISNSVLAHLSKSNSRTFQGLSRTFKDPQEPCSKAP